MSGAASGHGDAAASGEPAPLAGMHLLIASVGISLGFFLALLDLTIANVAVPHIAGSLNMSAAQGTLVITSYAVAEAICLPLTGWLTKRFGSLTTYIAALVGFMIASALCGAAGSMEMLMICRVLQGLFGAPLLPLCQTLLLRIFPKERSGIAVAVASMTAVVAPIAGPMIGGFITDNYSWRWIFYLNVPFTLLSIYMVLLKLRPFETARVVERIDFVGLALLVIWVGALQLMLDLGRENDWFASPMIVTLGITAVIGFAAFVIWELTEQTPIVDLKILRYRGFWTSTLCISVGYATFMFGAVLVPLWAQTAMGYTATQAGILMAPLSILSLLAIPLAGRLVNRIDVRIMICFGLGWQGVVGLLRTLVSTDLPMSWLALPNLLQGLATAFYMLGLTVVALGSVPQRDLAAAAGLMAFLRTIATAAGISAGTTFWDVGAREARAQLVGVMGRTPDFTSLLGRAGVSELQARSVVERLVDVQSSTISFDEAFLVSGVLCLAAAQLVWLIPRQRRR